MIASTLIAKPQTRQGRKTRQAATCLAAARQVFVARMAEVKDDEDGFRQQIEGTAAALGAVLPLLPAAPSIGRACDEIEYGVVLLVEACSLLGDVANVDGLYEIVAVFAGLTAGHLIHLEGWQEKFAERLADDLASVR